jgi:RNA polymerase sigma factor (sigma-70 family)
LEASALQHASRLPALPGRTPLLRLQSDERLIALARRGNQAAFEALVQRYQSRLLAFCRHMLGSTEDAEDVLQEVFAASYNAMLADERPINARPWLYRIARNRCLNHLRRPTAAGQDSMDVFERDGGTSTADTVHKREEFRQIVADVQDLPETQRTALLLREIDALSYDQIAHAMDTTVPSVKSLLVRARVSLAEAAEARLLSCDEVRLELGQVAEGLARTTPPVRRHLRTCDRCRTFRTELRRANRALAAVYPIGALASVKLFVSKLSLGAASGGSSSAATGGAGIAATSAGGTTAGGLLSAGATSLATKAAAGLAAAAIVTAGAAEVKQATHRALSAHSHSAATAVVTPQQDAVAALPTIVKQSLPPLSETALAPTQDKPVKDEPAAEATQDGTDTSAPPATDAVAEPPAVDVAITPAPPESPPDTVEEPPPTVPDDSPPGEDGTTQEEHSTITLPPAGEDTGGGGTSGDGAAASNGAVGGYDTPPAGESSDAPGAAAAPAAGESVTGG